MIPQPPAPGDHIRAADPTTDPAELARLAYEHPELRATIASNPSAYPGLLEWLRQYGSDAAETVAIATATPATPATSSAPLTPAAPTPAALTPAAPTPADPPAPRRTAPAWLFGTGAGVVLLAVAGAVVLTGIGTATAAASNAVFQQQYTAAARESDRAAAEAQAGGGGADTTSSATTGSGTSTATDSTPAATPTTASTPDAPTLPAVCGGLWSASYTASLQGQGYQLTSGEGAESSDPTEQALLNDTNEQLSCTWAKTDGSSVLSTTVSAIDASTAAQATQRFVARGMTTGTDTHGTRYYVSAPTGGESNLIVDGVWFCTTWTGLGPVGYTQDMSTRMFG